METKRRLFCLSSLQPIWVCRFFLSCIALLLTENRFPPRIQPHTRDSTDRPPPNRNHLDLGPASIAPSLPIPCQADAAADSNLPFLARYLVCLDGQLSTIREGGASKPRKRWQQPHKSLGLRITSDQAVEGVQHPRVDRCSFLRLLPSSRNRPSRINNSRAEMGSEESPSTGCGTNIGSRSRNKSFCQTIPCTPTCCPTTRGHMGRNYCVPLSCRQPSQTEALNTTKSRIHKTCADFATLAGTKPKCWIWHTLTSTSWVTI